MATDVTGREVPARRAAVGLPHGRELALALERVSRDIRDPAAKLRFIRASLQRYARVDRAVSSVPFAPLRRVIYHIVGLEGLRRLVEANPFLDQQTATAIARGRRVLKASVVLLVAGFGIVVSEWVRETLAAPEAAQTRPLHAEQVSAASPAAEAPGPIPADAQAPSRAWLVERGQGWEQYSNGLRIELSHVASGPARRYKIFRKGVGLLDDVHDVPVGLLYHTSESDIWPLQEAFNESLRDSSQRLLRYIQRKRLYNYVIDRFGRVFRIIPDAERANHAGYSIWAVEQDVYLNLNNAFIGICFESRWQGGHASPITRAQLSAGRMLTEYLRQRYAIAPQMCVTHGITSVNPRKHLIGHHVDWARGFPFAAYGLPDHYERPAPSVELFGFGYDEDFLTVMGEPWEGVRRAEDLLARDAVRQGVSVEVLRTERQALYDRWLESLMRDEERARPAASARNARVGASGG